MSRTVNNLVVQGFVTRELEPEDRRYVRIELTEAGRKVFSSIESRMSDYFQGVYNNIPETKRAQVLESLGILLRAMTDKCC
jgi:DNA-binding MarR family transcriptional regulator